MDVWIWPSGEGEDRALFGAVRGSGAKERNISEQGEGGKGMGAVVVRLVTRLASSTTLFSTEVNVILSSSGLTTLYPTSCEDKTRG